VQDKPLDIPTRSIAISRGQALASQMQRMRTELYGMHDQLNQDLVGVVRQANQLVEQVAGLNVEIVRAEATGQGAASALRDQRDGVLRQLAELMDIQTAETPEGAVSVYVGNEPLVQYGESRGLVADLEQAGDRNLVTVRFADNNGRVTIESGQIGGIIKARDEHLYGQIQELDKLAVNLMHQVNRLHSQGQGLDGLTDVTGLFAVDDPAAALNATAAGLSLQPENGDFTITVKDEATGQSVEHVIPVTLTGLGADTSLNDLVNHINANVANVTASVTSENRLRIQADDGWSFTFSDDTGGSLAALGMNAFFTGTSAADIAVDAELAADPRRLAAAMSNRPGDGSNAGRLADLATAPVAGLNNLSIVDQWHAVVGQLAVAGASAKHAGEATHSVSQSLLAQRETISGVNMDEEAVGLMRYQRSFQAAARYITVVDELVNEMLAMVR
jgi:flagellar hook-associated protein 1 FlgK